MKISLATAFLLSLIIPFLVKPVNGLYEIDELQGLSSYCFLHADRAAQGENVVNDLIKSGLANSTYYDWSCSKIDSTLQSERAAESFSEQAFAHHCKYGNLTPSQYRECDRGGYSSSGTMCLFEEDRKEAERVILEESFAPYQALDLSIELENLNPSLAQPLTPAEQSECRVTGHLPTQEAEEEEEDYESRKDKDIK